MPNLWKLHRDTFEPEYESFDEWWARVKDTPYRPQEELMRLISNGLSMNKKYQMRWSR